jgi:hypothetical protein
LVAAIPLATLFGGYLTLRLAYLPGSSDETPEPVTRTGQAQDVELGPDREAARRQLGVTLTIIDREIDARQVTGTALSVTPLQLRFVHPSHAGADRLVVLQPDGTGWQAQLPPLMAAEWRLQLSDTDFHWRVVGRMPLHATQVELQSALSP